MTMAMGYVYQVYVFENYDLIYPIWLLSQPYCLLYMCAHASLIELTVPSASSTDKVCIQII